MRELFINSIWQKSGDTSRTYIFTLTDEQGYKVSFNDSDNVVVKMGNKTGYLKDVDCEVTDKAINVDSKQFKDLPSGYYYFEVWVTDENGRKSIYPDDGTKSIYLANNIENVNGKVISTITIDELRKEIASSGSTSVPGPPGPVGPQGPKGDKGDTGPKGNDGFTPQIDSNGHWKIGNTTTQYSVGMRDQDDSATLLDLNTDRAVYYPSEKVVFYATSVSGHGHLVVKYYHLNNLVATKEIYYGTSEISWSWFLPADDNIGYAVVIENHVGNNVSTNTIAINVSNDIYNFPIMGFLSKYDNDSSVERKKKLRLFEASAY